MICLIIKSSISDKFLLDVSKVIKMVRCFLSIIAIIICGCSTVTSRTHPIIDPSEIKKDPIHRSLLIRAIAFPRTEVTYFLKDPLIKAANDLGLFTEVAYSEIDIEGPHSFYQKSDNEIFNYIYEKMPKPNLNDNSYVIDFVALPKRIDHGFGSTLLSAFTLGIIPARREFDFKVGIRLHTRNATNEIILIENYSYEMSSIPKKGSHSQVTWEKEPLANLIKVAIKEFQSKGLM